MNKLFSDFVDNNKGGATALLLILGVVVVIGGLLAGVGFTPPQKPFEANDIGEIINVPTADQKRDELQINTLGFRRITVTPSPVVIPPTNPAEPTKPPIPSGPTPAPDIVACRAYQDLVLDKTPDLKWAINPNTGAKCVMDGPAESPAQCCPDVPLCLNGPGSSCNVTPYDITKCPTWCDAKPVIYLYPTVPTYVNVSLVLPGKVIESDPLYPDSGWQQVLAYPDGNLIYQGNSYKELFYEAAIDRTDAPKQGIVVASRNIKATLATITTKLGLNSTEQQEFLDYWTPRLQDLKSPYMMISVFDPAAKDRIDHVDISPKPDTFIQFIMYYKALNAPISVEPLQLPAVIPQRIGFTAVEWGGIIDK